MTAPRKKWRYVYEIVPLTKDGAVKIVRLEMQRWNETPKSEHWERFTPAFTMNLLAFREFMVLVGDKVDFIKAEQLETEE